MSKAGVGLAAAAGSFVGLVVGSIAGTALARRASGREDKMGTLVLSSVLGTAAGAFAGAAWAAPESNTVVTTTTGAAGLPRRPSGVGAISAADATLSRYDGRYDGKEPPHRCTAASATAIAQQLPGAPWTFERSLDKDASIPWPTVEQMYDVVTPMGPKTIPAQLGNGRLVTRCPYTGQWFVFRPGASA